jgi:hypothetical protein
MPVMSRSRRRASCRLLEVHAHHDEEVGREALAFGLQSLRVFARGVEVMDRAGAHDHQQPVVGAAQDVVDALAGLEGDALGVVRGGEHAHHLHGREELVALLDAYVVGAVVGHGRPVIENKKPPVCGWRFLGNPRARSARASFSRPPWAWETRS